MDQFCCIYASPAAYMQPLPHICNHCCIFAALAFMQSCCIYASPAAYTQPLLCICKPCCINAATTAYMQLLLHLSSSCCIISIIDTMQAVGHDPNCCSQTPSLEPCSSPHINQLAAKQRFALTACGRSSCGLRLCSLNAPKMNKG